MGAPYLVLAISVIPTILTYQRVREAVESRDRERFHAEIKTMGDDIRERLRHYEAQLRALRALFATGTPDAVAWRNYVVAIDLPRYLPGIRSLGYVEKVLSADKAAHLARQRMFIPGYRITPEGERDDYFPTVYLNLFEALLLPEFGVDAQADPTLRTAMEKGRDSGYASLSGKVGVLAGTSTNRQAGFVIFMPIYKKDAPTGTVEERRAAIQGSVFGTFAVDKLLLGIFDRREFDRREAPTLDVEVFDGEFATPRDSMHADRRARAPGGPAEETSLTATRTLQVLDRKWTMRFTALPAFEASSQSQLPFVVLLAGFGVNLLLFLITWSQSHAKFRAIQLSDDLRRLQERDRLLERATNDAIWDWSIETNQLAWNEAVQHMFGYAPLTIRPHMDWWKERLHPDDRRRILNGRDLAIQTGGEFWADEYRFRKGDGSFADVIDRGYIIHNKQGVPVRMIGSMVDVTGRKEAEEARLRSERKLALHVEQTPLAVIEWNLDFQVTEWNPAAERIFGYTDREAIGRHAFDLIVPEQVRAPVKRIWEELLTPPAKGAAEAGSRATGRRSINENFTKDGRLIICEWYNTPLIDKSGQIVGVASLALDVTANKRVEAALAAETERLAVTLRSIAEAVMVTDITGRIILINKMAEHLTRTNQADVMGRSLGEIFHILGVKTRQPEEDPVAKVLEAEGVLELNNRTALLQQDHGELTIAYSCSPVVNAANKVIGTVLVFRDITTEQRTTEELLKASKLESVGVLAGGIAHDFNNIMTAVIGNLSLAKLYCQPGDKVHQRLEEAEKASLRTKDLTQQLLTFAKGGAPVKATSSITELIQGSAEFALRGSNVRSEFHFPPGIWPVEVDQGQFSQVVHNLVINSMQAMPEGGVIKILGENISLERRHGLPLPPGRFVKVSVRDTGIGIKPDNLPRVFDPYFTTKEKGTGLGLAVSYSIIKKHEGLITVESAVGLGTTFHIFLPASSKPVPAQEVAKDEPITGSGRVLVMDDDPLIRELAQTVLQYLGYEVETVSDGSECIRSYTIAMSAGRPFAALVMDLTIPGGMGGKETIKKLLEIDPAVRAIVSSGYSSGPEMANYQQHGFRGVVAKPYKIEELAKALNAVIKNGQV